MNPKVDEFIAKAKKWQPEMHALRAILLDCGLEEELKWKQPCYTYKNTNMAIIAAFKDSICLSFLKGVLLNDSENILVSPGENSQSVRFAKFTNAEEIRANKATLTAYLYEAIELEKAGIKVELKKPSDLELVEELEEILAKNKKLKTAFEALTSGRQRAYNLHFSAAKQSTTRISRIEKLTDRILAGYGINDCTCGHSKRKPNCDGSHKYL